MVAGLKTLPWASGDREAHILQQPGIVNLRMFKLDSENWILPLFLASFAFAVLYTLWPYIIAGANMLRI